MASKKYLNLHKSKRGGYATLILLISSMIIIAPLLAVTFGQAEKFSYLANMLIRQKQERIVALTSINKSVEFLSTSGIHYFFPEDTLVNPSSSFELLVSEDSRIIGEYTLSSEIYNMNYVISDDADILSYMPMSDIIKFPPSRKAVAGEKHFLIVTTILKEKLPSYRMETAVEIAPSGNANELWSREFVIY